MHEDSLVGIDKGKVRGTIADFMFRKKSIRLKSLFNGFFEKE
jgi:hypothetical protein